MTDIRHTLRFPSSHTSACRLQEEGDNITPNEQAYDDPRPQKQAVLSVQPGSDTGQNDIVLSEESAGREEDELSCKGLFFRIGDKNVEEPKIRGRTYHGHTDIQTERVGLILHREPKNETDDHGCTRDCQGQHPLLPLTP